jgi:hypothetical protein
MAFSISTTARWTILSSSEAMPSGRSRPSDFGMKCRRDDNGWMMRFLEHRIGDRRILRLVRKRLTVGIVDETGERQPATVGSPQGAVISPLLANLYLHHVYDLWARKWYRQHATGEVLVARYADDTVVGFEHRADAERFLQDLRQRMAKFALDLQRADRLSGSIRFAARSPQDPADRVWKAGSRKPGREQGRQTGDLRLSRLHSHLRMLAARRLSAAAP